ncbi:MAG TPA: SRPBCC domain-containing protein [Acidimicrobiales bacterium]|nr:SRPBCC domain-containing protein [Acidimicrobiales bacterium]
MIRRQLVIPASPELLWSALTDPEQLQGWFGGVFEWELAGGSPLRFRGDDGESRHGVIDALREGRYLRFTWWPEGQPDEASEVSYLIEPDEGGVRLTVQERPLESPAGATPPRACVRTPVRSVGWTPWDTRLAGAWAGVAAGSLSTGGPGNPSLRARS